MTNRLQQQFQGSLLGAALGQFRYQSRSQFESGRAPLEKTSAQIPLLGQRLVQIARILTQTSTPEIFPGGIAQDWSAFLPIILFFHEEPLPQRLQKMGLAELSQTEESLVLGYVINQILRQAVQAEELIPQTIAYLQTQKTHASLLQSQLNQVQLWLQQKTSLATIKAGLHQQEQDYSPVVLALLSFLNTVADFRLTIDWSLALATQPEMTAMLAGGLSGAYNGLIGLPLAWRSSLQQAWSKHQIWELQDETDLLALANQLFFSWSGVYSPQANFHSSHLPNAAIMAANIA